MKGVKLCYGLLPALFIMVGLSLNVSSDVNALKYKISTFNIGQDVYRFHKTDLETGFVYGYNRFGNTLRLGFKRPTELPDSFQFPHTWIFSGRLLNDNDQLSCELSQYNDGVRFNSYSDDFDYFNNMLTDTGLDYYNLTPDNSPFDLTHPLTSGDNQWLLTTFGDRLCSMSNLDYTSTTETPPVINQYLPLWDWSSLINIPLVNSRFSYEASKPFTYAYNRIYLNDKSTVDGVVLNTNGLKMSSLFNAEIHQFSALNIPFSFFSDPNNNLEYDRPPNEAETISKFTLMGSIVFDSDYTFVHQGCVYNPSCLSIEVTNVNLDSRVSPSDIDTPQVLPSGTPLYDFSGVASSSYVQNACSYDEYHIINGSGENRIDFRCSYSPSDSPNASMLSNNIDFSKLDINLYFGSIGHGDVNPNVISTNGDYTFTDFYLVTNDNFTSTDWLDASGNPTGGDPFSAPGHSSGSYGNELQPDFFTSLTNMFTFNLLNPFAPILYLFTDSTSCAQIPIIAGMLHSEETQVCPWFSNETRSILTPVFGLGSSMLLFGFAVRWLGSASGNNFEDSETHSAFGYQVKQKGKGKK